MSEKIIEASAAEATMRERRRGGRIACRWLESNFGTVVDMSTSGVRARTRGRPGVQAGDAVVLKLITGMGTLLVCSRVVRVQRVRGGHDVGFEFCEKDKDLRAALAQAARMHGKGETLGEEAADRLCAK